MIDVERYFYGISGESEVNEVYPGYYQAAD